MVYMECKTEIDIQIILYRVLKRSFQPKRPPKNNTTFHTSGGSIYLDIITKIQLIIMGEK